jgi:hypothetical protein
MAKGVGVDPGTIAKHLCVAGVVFRNKTDGVTEFCKRQASIRMKGYSPSAETVEKLRAPRPHTKNQNPSTALKLQRGRAQSYKKFEIPKGLGCQCWHGCKNKARTRAHLSGDTSDNSVENIGFWCSHCNALHGPPAWSSEEGVEPNVLGIRPGMRLGSLVRQSFRLRGSVFSGVEGLDKESVEKVLMVFLDACAWFGSKDLDLNALVTLEFSKSLKRRKKI